MVSFVCRRCNFKFTPRAARANPPLMCHNCGGKETIEKAPDAQQIIMESDKY